MMVGQVASIRAHCHPKATLENRVKEVTSAELLPPARHCAKCFHSLFIVDSTSGEETSSSWQQSSEVLELVHHHTIMIMVLREVYDSSPDGMGTRKMCSFLSSCP